MGKRTGIMKEIISYQTNSTMKNEEKILELLAESLKGQDRIVARLDVMDSRLDNVETKLGNLEKRTDRIEDQMVKLNLRTVENTRAIFKLAEKVEQIADLSNRVTKLEKVVYK